MTVAHEVQSALRRTENLCGIYFRIIELNACDGQAPVAQTCHLQNDH